MATKRAKLDDRHTRADDILAYVATHPGCTMYAVCHGLGTASSPEYLKGLCFRLLYRGDLVDGGTSQRAALYVADR